MPCQFLHLITAIVELCPIFLFELFPSTWVVPKRFSQCRARRDFLQPFLELRIAFLQASRPKAINQDTISIGFGGLIINTFDSNTHAWLSQQDLASVVLLRRRFC